MHGDEFPPVTPDTLPPASALDTLFNATDASVFLTDRQGRIVIANDGTARRLGKALNELHGAALVDLLPPESAVRWAAALNQAVTTGKTVRFQDLRDGLHFDTVCWPVVGPRHDVSAVAVYTHEITDLKRAEQALRESEERYRALAEENARLLAQARSDAEAKSILLQEVNHRVKNNLASILGILELELGRPPGEKDDFHRMLQALSVRIRGLSIVHDILSASAWLPVRLEELLSSVVHGARATVPAGKSITVTIVPPARPLWIVPKQATALALIANELATNSIKYALEHREKGTITIRLSPEADGTVLVEYRDDGPGWPEEVLNGRQENIGLRLIRLNARSPLRGTFDLRNDNGAVALLRFSLNPVSEPLSRGEDP